MREDWARLIDAIATIILSAEEYVPRIISGEWDSKDFIDRQNAGRDAYWKFVENPANILGLLKKIERLEELCRQPWDAWMVKTVMDRHKDRLFEAWEHEPDVPTTHSQAIDKLMQDWASIAWEPYPDFESDPDEQIPFVRLSDEPPKVSVSTSRKSAGASAALDVLGKRNLDNLDPSPFE